MMWKSPSKSRASVSSWLFIAGLAVLPWLGCLKPAVRAPPPVVIPPPPGPRVDLRSHLLGVWELPSRSGTKRMVFEPDGRVTFQGGLESYNPAHWSLNEGAQELTLTFPNASDKNLDIFHLYVGQGVQSFDRRQKSAIYRFNSETWSLNVAGWIYSKQEKADATPLAEPVIR